MINRGPGTTLCSALAVALILAGTIVFAGDMAVKGRPGLAAEKKGAISARKAKSLPLEKAVKIGSGGKIVIEVTDPDCPYCRQASAYFDKRSDVTRYVFLAPLAHPAAVTKVEYILAAENKADAYNEMMSGKPVPAGFRAGTAAQEAAREHLALARTIGITATPSFFSKEEHVVGSNFKKLDELLKD